MLRQAYRHRSLSKASCPATVEPLEDRRLLAAQLVADARPGETGIQFIEPGVVAENNLFLTTGAPWVTNGYAFGTTQLIPLDKTYLSARHLAAHNGTLYFGGDPNGQFAFELWKSDGTPAGTTLVKDINPDPTFPPGSGYSNPHSIVGLGDHVLFIAFDGRNGNELWRSDGTEAGTFMLKDIRPGFPSGMGTQSPIQYASPKIVTVGDVAYFAADAEGDGFDLWKTDGTAAGTVVVKKGVIGGPGGAEITAFRDGVAFVGKDATGIGLWYSDGTDAGTVRIPDDSGGGLRGLFVAGDYLYFYDQARNEHWRSDGTAAGTVRLKDVLPESILGGFQNFRALGELLIFIADDAQGPALWASDGTEAGTSVLRRLSKKAFGNPYWGGGVSHVVGGRAYFSMTGDDKGQELWATDGTVEGTVRVTDINPGPADSAPEIYGALGETLIFLATDPVHGRELWKIAPPTADARGDHESHPWPAFYRVGAGQSVVLKGHWSTDPDWNNELLTHTWDMDGDGIFGETGIAAERGDEVGMFPRFSADGLAPGTYPVKLRVVNTSGLSDEDEVDVVVTGGGEVKRIVGTDGEDSWAFGASEDTFYVYDRNAPGNDPVYAWPIESVAAVEFVGLGGDDYLTVSGEVEMSVRFDGGGGYDEVGVGCDNYDFAGNWEELRAWDGYGLMLHEDVTLEHVEVTGDAPLTLAPGANMTLRVRSLEIDEYNGSKVELHDNTLIITPDPAELDAVLARVEQWVNDGRVWQGDLGILSYTAARDPRGLTGVAVAVRDGEIIVKRAYNGDVNLDGRVNADDYFRIDQGFLAQPQDPRYAQGDFNYDGKIDADDYFLIDQAFLGQAAPLAGSGGNASAMPSPTPLRSNSRTITDDDVLLRARSRSARVEVPRVQTRRARSRPSA